MKIAIVGRYKNGNYTVTIMNDGTKIRENDLDFFEPEFPESFDIKITDCCDMGCPMCHENSSPNGKHGDILNLPFIDSLHPFTELAIGGGNPLSHPGLEEFLFCAKERKLIPNLTVNQVHFMQNIPLLHRFCEQGLIYGLGISYINGDYKSTQEFIKKVKQFPNAVIHVINGMVSMEQLSWLSAEGLKILVLGYKTFRRGEGHFQKESPSILKKIGDLYQALPSIVESEWFEAISFDNLAITQLDVKRLMSEDEWSEFYMGDDGRDGEFNSASMYIDAVKGEFARNSCSEERYPITNNITEMFQFLRKEKINES